MAILGANFGEVAIPKVGGGYYISTPKGKTIKHTTTSVPKKTTTTKPKTTTTKTVSAPVASASANYQTVAAPTAAPVQSAPTMEDLINKYLNSSSTDINSIYDKQKQSQLDQLKSQRDTAIGQTKQDYYNQRNAADVVNMQNVQKLREIMGQNGLLNSGENLTATAQSNADRQNSLNSLNLQEQAKINDINNPAKDQAIIDQVESARAKALLDAKNSAVEKAWRDYIYNNMSAAQQAQLGMNKYQIDATNSANAAANQAALNYYSSAGFNGSSGGGGSYQSDLQKAISRGLDPSWVSALNYIVGKESSYDSNARNKKSTAYGYGQFLADTRANYEKKTGLSYNDPVNQLIMTAQYMKDRYGTPQGAINFWNANKWY